MRRLLASLVLLLAASAGATNYYAVAGGAGTGDGSSWENGAADLQSLVQSRTSAVTSTNVVYAGAGTWTMTNTVLLPSNTWIVASNGATVVLDGNSTCQVVRSMGKWTKLDGLRLVNGISTNNGGGAAGFAAAAGGYVTVTNCTVSNCWSLSPGGSGGGLYWADAWNCAVDSCYASNGVSAYGGGARASSLRGCVVRNCRSSSYGGGISWSSNWSSDISSNFATYGGGGVYNCYVSNCVVNSNAVGIVGYGGGGMEVWGYSSYFGYNTAIGNDLQIGGGIHCSASVVGMTNFTVAYNQSRHASGGGGGGVGGAAARLYGGVVFSNKACVAGAGVSGPTCYNVYIFGNSVTGNATGGGGARNANLYGCVLSSNSSPVYSSISTPKEVVNCTIIGHTNAAPIVQFTNKYAFANNIVYGNASNLIYNTTNAFNNWTNDPVFLGDPLYPWKLSPLSPCIDAGNGTPVPALLALDFYGRARTQGAAIDIGVSEYTSTNDFLPAASGRTKARLASLLFGWRSP